MTNLRAPELGTYLLSDTEDGLILGQSAGLTRFSIQALVGTPTILGNKTMRGVDTSGGGSVDLTPVAVPLPVGEIFNWSVETGIDEVIIGMPVGSSAKLMVL